MDDAARARDPDTPPDELFALAAEEPDAVLTNPALPLIALEDPAAHRRIVRQADLTRAARAVRAGLKRLDTARLRGFAVDCAERALILYEALRPRDDRPRRAVEVARRYVSGRAARSELMAARNAAASAVSEGPRSIARAGEEAALLAAYVAKNSTYLADEEYADRAPDPAAELRAVALDLIEAAAQAFGRVGKDTHLEALKWQVERLGEYL